jgi:TolA-binding protein
MDRQERRDLKHDKFVDEIGALSIRARDNQRLLYGITAAIVALAVIGYGIYFYRATQEEKAKDALAQAIETMESPLMPAAGQPPVPNAKFKTEAERTAKAETMFKDVDAKFSGTTSADIAGVYLARILTGRGDYANARKYLERFVKNQPEHTVAVGEARYSLYQLRIENGEAPQVITELQQEIGKRDDAVLPADTLLVLLAHAYDSQGDGQKSRDTYRRITVEFPDSPYALESQRRVGGPA